MVFFKNKDDRSEDWKEKYFKLLDSQEQSEKNHKANQELLCKTITRFALSAKGFNNSLDPYLDRIRAVLKSGLQSQQLQKELEAFSNALMFLEESSADTHLDASLLFDFLYKQYPGRQLELAQIQGKYERREFMNYQRLFIALSELIDDRQQGQQDFAAELAVADANAISSRLISLLDNVDFPDVFSADAEQLKIRLHSGQALGPVFDDAVTLLLAIKKHMGIERQEMADFLSSLTEELAELGLKASGVTIANEDAVKKRSLFDREVTAQILDLQKKSANAVQLEPLKQLIGIRMVGISQQIQSHNAQEQMERERILREFRGLTQQLRDMESETIDLQSRLDIAQLKASRDPLTNLPNRSAFEDRLVYEMTRCKRHGGPLSMAIWDIDFFKNINDTYGHKSGDKALVIISKLLSGHCRASDFVSRYGGEEFVLLLPETDAQAALVLADKLRETVEKSSFYANGDKVRITISCGISQYVYGDTSESFFERADGALYKAKQSGRNQCQIAESEANS